MVSKPTRKVAPLPIPPSTSQPSGAASRPRAAKASGKATVVSSKVSYQGKVFSVTTDRVTEPGGSTQTRDVIRHNGSIVILAVDASANPDDPSIVIIRQYRHAAGQFLLELPAGRIEPGEAPLAAAKRELIEETGYRAKRWSRLVRYYASPGFLGETMQVFLAEDLRLGEAQPEADEHITLELVPVSDVLTRIQAEKIIDGKTIIATLLYLQNLRLLNK